MNDNMIIYDQVRKPPKTALKQIGGGRLKGMTDINPQWRYEAMTRIFGPYGIGWWHTIDKQWAEEREGEVCAFVNITLWYVWEGKESKGLPGSGGSKLVTSERNGIYVSDEAYKMAETDAISTAMKKLGLGGDIYAGRWDGSKYKNDGANDKKQSPPKKPNASKFTDIQDLRGKIVYGINALSIDADGKKELEDKFLGTSLATCTDVAKLNNLRNHLVALYKESGKNEQ